jgi:hypothetical protein
MLMTAADKADNRMALTLSFVFWLRARLRARCSTLRHSRRLFNSFSVLHYEPADPLALADPVDAACPVTTAVLSVSLATNTRRTSAMPVHRSRRLDMALDEVVK